MKIFRILKILYLSQKIDIDYASFNIAAAVPGSSFRKKAIEYFEKLMKKI